MHSLSFVSVGAPCGFSSKSKKKLFHVKKGKKVIATITEVYPDVVVLAYANPDPKAQTKFINKWVNSVEVAKVVANATFLH